MVKVAVAGGTGCLGRHIVEAILAKKDTVVVLSRSSSHPTLEALGAQISQVAYDDHSSLVEALRGVHTVISAILSMDETLKTSQLALLRAALDAGVKRFAPSEFAVIGLPDDTMELYRLKPPVADAVANSGLEWTLFENGMFMNYFAHETDGIGHLFPTSFVVDVKNGTAKIPNTGDQKITFTRAEDVGAFVAASLDLEKWPKHSRMVGDTISYNEIVALAEKVTGRKFNVTYVSEETLRKEMVPNSPSLAVNLFNEVFMELGYGSRFRLEGNLNTLCPEVKPVKVGAFLEKWWGSA